jgi:hypothetical protein
MDYTRVNNNSTESLASPTGSNVTTERSVEVVVSPPPEEQSRNVSFSIPRRSDALYNLSDNREDSIVEQPTNLPLSEGQRLRISRKERWTSSTVSLSLSREWNKAVDTRAAWPRYVYALGGVIFIAIWIGIT